MWKTMNNALNSMVAWVESLPEGTEVSVAEVLTSSVGEDEARKYLSDTKLMFELDKQFRRMIKQRFVIANSSDCTDGEIGLPFNIPFVICRRKDA